MNEEMMEEFTPRVFNIVGEINDKLAEDFLNWVLLIENDDFLYREAFPDSELPVVTINISSFGGMCHAMDVILDAMDLLECTIVTRAFGYVASCGLWIFSRGDIRLAGNSTRFMYHQILYSIDGSLSDHVNMLSDSKNLQSRYDKILYDRTKITPKILNKHRNHDWWFRKEEALELGVVTTDTNKLKDLFQLEGEDEIERRIED